MYRWVVNMQGIQTKSEHLNAISSNDSKSFQHTNRSCYGVCRLYLYWDMIHISFQHFYSKTDLTSFKETSQFVFDIILNGTRGVSV